MSNDLPEKSQSDVVYLGVDVAHGHKLPQALAQINEFNKVDVKAWFCDIVHTPNQTPFALTLEQDLRMMLAQRSPKLRPANIVVCCNIESAHIFRARDKMYEIINTFRKKGAAENVNFKDPAGHTQPVEY